MTTAIQQGTMTRSRRRTRIEALIGQIKSVEQAQAKATATEQDRQMEQVRSVVENARGFGYEPSGTCAGAGRIGLRANCERYPPRL